MGDRESFGATVSGSLWTPPSLGLMSAGAVFGSTPDSGNWQLALTLVGVGFGGLTVALSSAYRAIRDERTLRTLTPPVFIAGLVALAGPAVLGIVVSAQASVAALVVLPLVLWSGFAGRWDVGRPAELTGYGFALLAALAAIIGSTTLDEGLNVVVQGAVVSLVGVVIVAACIAIVGESARRARKGAD